MSDLSQKLKAGTLLIIEAGAYSDLSWDGPVRILHDITKQELADAFVQDKLSLDEEPLACDFTAWLIRAGHADPVNGVHSWHVGSYGEFTP